MKALIDGDIFRYRHGFAGQTTTILVEHPDYGVLGEFPNKTTWLKYAESEELVVDDYEVTTVVDPEPVENVLHSVKVSINEILRETGADSYTVFLTGKGNFRETIYPEYKGNRSADKPVHYEAIGKYLEDIWHAEIVEGYEADDAMAMEQYSQREKQLNYADIQLPETIICSIDKDLDMVPGWHYNFVKKEKYFVTDDAGLRWFYKQMLTGDNVDNIIGCPGIGPKRADGSLSAAHTEREWACIVGLAYAIAFDDPEEQYKLNGHLLWMLRNLNDIETPPWLKMIDGRKREEDTE